MRIGGRTVRKNCNEEGDNTLLLSDCSVLRTDQTAKKCKNAEVLYIVINDGLRKVWRGVMF